MPKISAATVAEHRANRRAALLSAGESILREEGLAGINPRTVSERAGLARSSFYDYFDTKDDLLVSIAIAAFEEWGEAIDAALAGAEQGLPALEVLVEVTMARTADGKHAIAGALQEADLSPSRMEDLMKMHQVVTDPIKRILADLEVPSIVTASALVQAALNAGVQLVDHGLDHRQVASDVHGFIAHGLSR